MCLICHKLHIFFLKLALICYLKHNIYIDMQILNSQYHKKEKDDFLLEEL